jgi:SAM-dependent methyltransferase
MAQKLLSNNVVSTAELAAGLDPALTRALLRFLTIRKVVEPEGDGYRLTPRGRLLAHEVPMGVLGFYREAYGPVVDKLAPLLRGELTYGKEVIRDGEALGRHCSVLLHHFGTRTILEAFQRMNASCILDLGCGGGGFLVDACQQNPDLRGVGLDISAEAIAFARKWVADQGLSDRIDFVVGDAFRPETWPAICQKADALFTVGTLHEQFRDGEQAVIELLNKYAGMLKNRMKGFLLGEPELLYDQADADFFLVHAFTLQGLPRRKEDWLTLFPKTKLRCRHAFVTPDAGARFAYFDLTAT